MAVGPLGQVHISVTDVDRSVAFYRDVLGIPFLFAVPGQPMAFLQSGQVRLYLGVPEDRDFTSRCVVYFTVDDLDAEHARLHAADVPFTSEPHLVHRSGGTELWMAFCRDPDGHHVGLMHQRGAAD